MGEATGQCGTTAAAQLAQDAGVKKLALVHIGPNLSDPKTAKQAIEDAKSVFDGEIIFTDELMSFDI
jgi:ribonuclease BN (tRNA processing enzyme)